MRAVGVAFAINGVILAVSAIVTLAPVPSGGFESMALDVIGARSALVTSGLSLAGLALRRHRAAVILPLLGLPAILFLLLLGWFAVGILVHPYVILVPACGAILLAIAVILMPELSGLRLGLTAASGLALALGTIQLVLRNQHGSLVAGVVLVLAAGGLALAAVRAR